MTISPMLVATHPGPIEVPISSHVSPLSCRPKMLPNLPSSNAASSSTIPPTSTLPLAHPVKRACDACHRRKVRCIGDGSRPCKNCNSAGLTCTYNAIPQKKGPKGSRAKVISELRETQRQSQLVAKQTSDLFDSPPLSPTHMRRAGLLSTGMITACVDYFFANLYPTQPILHRQKVGETIGQMETSVEAYCLVVSLCAYMMIQPNMRLDPEVFEGEQPQPSVQLGHALLQEALRVRKSVDYIESPTIWSVITSFFLFGSYFCLDRQNTAWFHLREATTLAQIMGMHDESNYQMADIIESTRRRRLYWLLFITERAYALQQHRPLTLHATINLPTLEEDPADSVELRGFIHLVNLFRPFDDTFVGLWNKARVGCSTEWLTQLQQQLSNALPTYLNCTESQAVDLRCSQQWLRMMVWQLSISHGFLSSAAANNSMTFRFPVDVSRDLLESAATFSQASMEVHGIGLIEKLFDIACTLTDVMAVIPHEISSPTSDFSSMTGPRQYLSSLTQLIGTLRGGQQRYLPILIKKIEDTLPSQTQLAPSYGLSAIPDDLRPTNNSNDLYESSQGYSSEAHSGGSTPFGSPLSPSVGIAGTYGFADLTDTPSTMQFPQGAMTAFDASGIAPTYMKYEPSG